MIYLLVYMVLSFIVMGVVTYFLYQDDKITETHRGYGKNFLSSEGKFRVSADAALTLTIFAPGVNLFLILYIILRTPAIIKAAPRLYKERRQKKVTEQKNKLLQEQFEAENKMPWSFIRGSVVLKDKYAVLIRDAIEKYDGATAPLWVLVDFDFRPGSAAHAIIHWMTMNGSYMPGEAQSPLRGFGEDRVDYKLPGNKPQSVLSFDDDVTLRFYDSRLNGAQHHLAFVDLLAEIAIDYQVQLDLTRIKFPAGMGSSYHFNPGRNNYIPVNEEILQAGFFHRAQSKG